MSPNVILAGIMLISLVVYSLLGGADYGAGFWDLLSFGPNREGQRNLIARAIHPVWETNHVWLILLIVLMFSGFPAAFSAISVNLAVPLYLVLFGIVLRGSSYVFRAYFAGNPRVQLYWGRVFSISSSITPLFLGIVIGGISSDSVLANGFSGNAFLGAWFHPFPLVVGLLSLSLFAYLSACYLTVEAEDPTLQSDFRSRALTSGVASIVLAAFTYTMAGDSAHEIRDGLWSNPYAWLVEIGAVIATIAAFHALWKQYYLRVRIAAAAQVTFIVLGWGIAQFPYLVRPEITIYNGASPRPVLSALVIVVSIGAVVLIPSLALLLHIFKTEPKSAAPGFVEPEGRDERNARTQLQLISRTVGAFAGTFPKNPAARGPYREQGSCGLLRFRSSHAVPGLYGDGSRRRDISGRGNHRDFARTR
jgi:cytochrome d ubiquinol oxidase subunit II